MQLVYGFPGQKNDDELLDIYIYDKPGNYFWSKPSGCRYVIVWVVGGGGGGGSGRKGLAGSLRLGGSPGASAGINWMEVQADILSSNCSITVGEGGKGANKNTTNSTNGSSGSSGSSSSFGLQFNDYSSSSTILTSDGASGGSGGTSTTRGSPSTNQAFQLSHMFRPGGFYNNSQKFSASSGYGSDISTTNTIQYTNNFPHGYDMDVYGFMNKIFFSGAIANPASGGTIGLDGCKGIHGVGGGGGGPGTDSSVDAGAGGNGGDGLVIVMCFGGNIPCNFQGFNSNGQWYKPKDENFTTARIVCQAGGGGGGSGRRGLLTTARGGGNGGGAGGISIVTIPLNYLPDVVDVTVGLGGIGGVDTVTNDSNGNPGSNGGDSSFGNFIIAVGGGGGPGGIAGAGTSGGAGGTGTVVGFLNSNNSGGTGLANSAVNISYTTSTNLYCGGGGGGGRQANSSTNGAPSIGRTSQLYNAGSLHDGVGGTVNPRTPFATDDFFGICASSPAIGGRADGYTVGASGSNAKRGGGGGGGGGMTNGGAANNAGGNGGDGQVYILCY